MPAVWGKEKKFSSVQSLSHVWVFVTPWTAARQASLSITNCWSPPKPGKVYERHLQITHQICVYVYGYWYGHVCIHSYVFVCMDQYMWLCAHTCSYTESAHRISLTFISPCSYYFKKARLHSQLRTYAEAQTISFLLKFLVEEVELLVRQSVFSKLSDTRGNHLLFSS